MALHVPAPAGARVTAPHLSLILPAYNCGRIIEGVVRDVLEVLNGLERTFEIVIVCDGSTDGTAECARRVEDSRVRVLSYPDNLGKGGAICYGIAHSEGRLIGWLDADGDLHPSVIVDAVRRFDESPLDAVIGSKRAPGSQVDYPWYRRVFSAIFQVLVRLAFRLNVRDTQVGAKVFRREALDTVAPLLLIKRYAFDLEVLAVATEFGFDRVEEIPVRLEYRFTGTGINVEAIKRMVIDTMAIAYRIHLRHWYVRRYASLQRLRMDADLPGDVAPEAESAVAV
jgi:glycosyltransferase involved in cell wall biosynthesis